uniref:Alpha-1,3-glucosyltransferase n=2 Tax=Clytia hemisphaerica TaxID=252671 RepID=A0A7M5VAC0_9CNID
MWHCVSFKGGNSRGDSMYWGLDYPPLTAYHSKLCGFVANLMNPDWVALNTSRGYESYNHKLFMRATVLVADIFIYIVAVIAFVGITLKKYSSYEQVLLTTMLLSYPGLILIDHGHFQYNCISLGFTLFSTVFMMRQYHCISSMFFVLALNYKQMELYHSFPFFFYLLSVSWKQKTWLQSVVKLGGIGSTVIATFIISWLPFLKSLESAQLVVQRLFPFNRGLFEDKVANVWCAVSVVVKIKNLISQPQMVQLCLLSTVVACLPSCFDLLRNGTRKKFLYSMINCSLAFFLFSYQVHEKSILIPATSVCLILWMNPMAASWFLVISTFSMYPLLVRDGQSTSYFSLVILYVMLASFLCKSQSYSRWTKLVVSLSLTGCAALHLAFSLVDAPPSLPDLYPLLFSVYSCAHFVLFWLYFLYIQWNCPKHDSADLLSNKISSAKKIR